MSELVVGGHLVARALKNEGVSAIFTLCGGHVAPIYDGCLKEGIRILDTRHEQAAVMAADAFARLSRQVGVAIVTAGPGVTNAVTGVANAMQANVPLVVLGGAAELRFIGRGALQEMEQVTMMRPITKWAATVTDPRRIPEMLAAAFRTALSGVMGPVFLELPFDVLTGQVQDPVIPTAYRHQSRTALDTAGVEAIGALLHSATRPILFAGSQVWWDDAAQALRALAEQCGLPVFLNAMGRGSLPQGHPLLFSGARKKAFRSADLALVVGTPLDFRTGFGASIHAGAKLVQIDRDPTKIGQNRPISASIVGDMRSNLTALAAATSTGLRDRFAPWIAELKTAEEKSRLDQERFEKDDSAPMNHYRFGRAIADAIDPDTIIIGDGGDIVALASKVIPLAHPGHWLDPGPLGCLGVGAPFALAAKQLYPHRKVLVVSGDGSFGLNGFDFESCIRQELPVVCVVGNDAAWGQIRGPQIMLFGNERAPATKLAPTRYDRVVEGLGGRGEHIEDPRLLPAAIERGFASGQTTCINVPIDPDFMVKNSLSKLSV